MVVENPLALQYILPGDVFFLQADRADFSALAPTETVEIITVAEPKIEEAKPAPQPVIAETIPAIPAITPVVSITPTAPPEQAPAPAQSAPVAGFKYAGGYQKNFLVFVHYPQHDIMDAAHQSALEATIKRKDLSLDDIAIFNMGKHPGETLKAIGGFFKPQKMLFLGADALPGGWNAPAFNQLIKMSKCDVLYTYSFTEMMANRELAKAFWEQMKAL